MRGRVYLNDHSFHKKWNSATRRHRYIVEMFGKISVHSYCNYFFKFYEKKLATKGISDITKNPSNQWLVFETTECIEFNALFKLFLFLSMNVALIYLHISPEYTKTTVFLFKLPICARKWRNPSVVMYHDAFFSEFCSKSARWLPYLFWFRITRILLCQCWKPLLCMHSNGRQVMWKWKDQSWL